MQINNIAVLGAGTMGHGIAQVFALAGYPVKLFDNDPNQLSSALPRIKRNLQIFIEHGLINDKEATAVPTKISCVSQLSDAVKDADFIVEAVLEDLEIKHSLLRQVEASCKSDCIISSNSSSFKVGDMAVVLEKPHRFLGTHYWNPPHLVPLVEVIIGEQSNDETVDVTVELLTAVGKYPAIVKKDVPGFVGNRLQHALRREAIALVAEGIADPKDIDMITRLGFGLRLPLIGPLETVDLGGLDLTLAIQSYLLPDLDRSTMPKSLIYEKVSKGELGAKSGQGFFDWPEGKHAEAIERRDRGLLEIVNWLKSGGYLSN